jgi:hypothetical protein
MMKINVSLDLFSVIFLLEKQKNTEGPLSKQKQNPIFNNMEYQLVYQLFPRSFGITEDIKAVIACFEKNN